MNYCGKLHSPTLTSWGPTWTCCCTCSAWRTVGRLTGWDPNFRELDINLIHSGSTKPWKVSLMTTAAGMACLRLSRDQRTITRREHTSVSRCWWPCSPSAPRPGACWMGPGTWRGSGPGQWSGSMMSWRGVADTGHHMPALQVILVVTMEWKFSYSDYYSRV